MANGITAVQVDAAALSVDTSAKSYPCYLGQAPIWQIDDANWANLAGTVMLAKSIEEVRSKIGYAVPASGAFNKGLSLSMAMYYHTNIEKKLPIILIVNAGTVAASVSPTTKSLTFVKGKAVIDSAYVVLNTLSLNDGGSPATDYVKGTDWTAQYDADGQNVVITALDPAITSATASYKTVDPSTITFSKDTYDLIDYIGQETGVIPSTISAPGWDNETDSASATVMNALATVAEGVVDKHWYVEAFGQLAGGTRSAAKTAKANINSYKMKVCWPWVKINGYIFPISLVFSARKQSIDAGNDNVPYESASNEHIDVTGLCDASGTLIRQLELEADDLNSVGIATMAFTSNMNWRTWGVCMANYTEAGKGNIPANKLNDVAVQMMDYVCNDFEKKYGVKVHKPMSIREVNDILNDFGAEINQLISEGRLIGGTIAFEPSENSTAALADGEFTFTITEANTPPAKAIIGVVSYDVDAYDQYAEQIGGEG